MGNELLIPLSGKKNIYSIGSKGESLLKLSRAGFKTPVSLVIPWLAYQRFIQKDNYLLADLKKEINQKLDNKLYAVRSSANREDGFDFSFAGQFKSVLNVPKDQVIDAVIEVWNSTTNEMVQSYLEKIKLDYRHLQMGVVIQEMVSAVYSGVVFTKNPITGMDEFVIEAVKGFGTGLVQDGLTPYRWVHKWDRWISKPEQDGLDSEVLEKLVRQAKSIQATFNSDVDLEWVWDGVNIYWVQMREITCLNNLSIYSNSISKEQLPGMIKPLVWSINIPQVNGAWIRILTEFIGKNDLDPYILAKPFYYRAYYNMGVLGDIFVRLGLPRQILEIMMGMDKQHGKMPKIKFTKQMIWLAPNIIRSMVDKFHFPQKIDKFILELEEEQRTFNINNLEKLHEKELLAEIDRLFNMNQRAAYYFILGPLPMYVYNGMLNQQLKKIGESFEEIDVTEQMTELERFDPSIGIRRLHEEYIHLSDEQKNLLRVGSIDSLTGQSGGETFRAAFIKFMLDFGHLSDSGNNFSTVPWRENPDLILRLVENYNPHHSTSRKKLSYADIKKPFPRVLALNILYKLARTYRYYREYIGYVYNFGYGLYRNYFLAMADLLLENGMLAERDDIFYVSREEIIQLVNGEIGKDVALQWITRRKKEMEEYRNIILPTVIYGETPPPIELPNSKKITGTPTSCGYCHGPVKKVWGLQDFEKLEDGDILVIPYSDVSWAPLFAKAAGVISESGGMLSHSSIIAREYKIPAVVSVAEAPMLKDGMRVTIDGYKGEINIFDDAL
jgi:phosphoenolpyruvate synthase/pyruvate phosphate dikinase